MIYLDLFIAFFKIGLFTFGGGYAMIPLIRDEVVSHGWLNEEQILNFIGVSESTPGPFAINMATYVGSTVGESSGHVAIIGALCATFGVVLPSFIIILIIAKLLKNFAENRFVKGVIHGINPVAIGLIAATGVTVFIGNIYANFREFGSRPDIDFRAIIIALIIGAVYALFKFILKKKLSPILLILVSAVLGIIIYAL